MRNFSRDLQKSGINYGKIMLRKRGNGLMFAAGEAWGIRDVTHSLI